jgi:flavin-binding protein dodecin
MALKDDIETKALHPVEDKAVRGPKPRPRRTASEVAAAEVAEARPVIDEEPDTTELDAEVRDIDGHLEYVTFAHYQTVLGKDYAPGQKTRLPANIVAGLRAGGVVTPA